MEQYSMPSMEKCNSEEAVHFRNDLQRTGVFPHKGMGTFKKIKWKLKTHGRIYSSPVAFKDIILIGSEDGSLYAVDSMTGDVRWKFETGGAVRSTAAVSNHLAYVISLDGYLYAICIETGKEIWKFKTNGEMMKDPWDYFLSSPALNNGILYFGSGDHHIYAVNAFNGEEIWRYKTGGVVHASPAIYNQTVYIGSFDGYFYALNAKNGEQRWAFRTVGDTWFPNGDIQGTACISDGIVYFGSRDYNFYALDAETGRGKWNFKAPGTWIISTPSIKDNHVYFATSDHSHIYAMDAKTGDQIWSYAVHINTFGSASIAEDTMYIGNMNGKLYAINLKTGEVRWVYQTDVSKKNYPNLIDQDGKMNNQLLQKLREATTINDFIDIYDHVMTLGSIISTPYIDNDTIYFGSTDGYLYALQCQ